MREKLRFLGMDVHAETIAAAIAEPDGEVRSLGTIPNRMESIRKLLKKLGPVEKLRVCYEAGPTGYVLYWQLAELGVQCEVIAPSLVPVKAGDRVKTDRRDAEKLARSYRSGDLTAVWVPDAGSEALRDLVRAREAAKQANALIHQVFNRINYGVCRISPLKRSSIRLSCPNPAMNTTRRESTSAASARSVAKRSCPTTDRRFCPGTTRVM